MVTKAGPEEEEVMKPAAVPDHHNEESIESEVLLEETSGEDSENFGTMDEYVAADAVPDQ